MNYKRSFWVDLILRAWEEKNVIWLSGVRRSGKTCLCQSLDHMEYFDCELPQTRFRMEDPEAFLRSLDGKRVVLDEIHRLADPAGLLKIAADHFPGIKLIATGSSTLGASAKFKDTLTGRKRSIWLTPATCADLRDFRATDLDRRLLHGGLPGFLLAGSFPERDVQEWMDSYWAKDIQELFRLGRRHAFQRLFEMLMAHSGGIFEATRFAGPCEISRPTVVNYLSVLEATHVVHIVRPHSARTDAEIISAPKVYGFDTGFVACHRGWDRLRPDDRGPLWEHVVLNELHARLQSRDIRYWRDKRGHEVDFVLPARQGPVTAIECKWRMDSAFDVQNLKSFRARFPEGPNFIVCHDAKTPVPRTLDGIEVLFLGVEELVRRVGSTG